MIVFSISLMISCLAPLLYAKHSTKTQFFSQNITLPTGSQGLSGREGERGTAGSQGPSGIASGHLSFFSCLPDSRIGRLYVKLTHTCPDTAQTGFVYNPAHIKLKASPFPITCIVVWPDLVTQRLEITGSSTGAFAISKEIPPRTFINNQRGFLEGTYTLIFTNVKAGKSLPDMIDVEARHVANQTSNMRVIEHIVTSAGLERRLEYLYNTVKAQSGETSMSYYHQIFPSRSGSEVAGAQGYLSSVIHRDKVAGVRNEDSQRFSFYLDRTDMVAAN